MLVYVVSIEGKPLMPCKPAKARKLLKNKKAKIVKYEPFTIQLLFECENQIQECVLGIDAGERNGIKITEKNKLNNNRNVDFSKCISKIDSCVKTNQELEKMIHRLIKLSKESNVK